MDFDQLKKIGFKHIKKKNHILGADYLERALSIKYDKSVEKQLVKSSYLAIWSSYNEKNFEQMERFANLAINFLAKDIYYDAFSLAKAYNGLSIALNTLGKRTIENNLKAKALFDKLLKDTSINNTKRKKILKSRIYNDFGIIINLGFTGNFDEAMIICEENITLCTKYSLTLELGVTYKVYSELLYYFNMKEESLKYYRTSLKVLLQKKDQSSFRHHIGDIYLKVAMNLMEEEEYEKSLSCTNSAFNYLDDIGKNAFRFHYVRGVISEKYGEINKANEYYLKAFEMLLSLRLEMSTESNIDGFLSKKDRENTFKNAIRIQYKMNKPQRFIELLEKYRGVNFKDKIFRGEKPLLSGISIGLKNEINNIEREIKKSMSNYNLSAEEKAVKISKLEDRLYFCEEKIASNKKTYRIFGDYINIELHNILKDIQKALKPKQTIIEYFYHKDGVYIILINNKEVLMEFVEISSDHVEEILMNYLNYLKNYISNPRSSNIILKFYQNKIYEYFLEPISNKLSNDMELVIIPFEMLHIFPLHIIYFEKFSGIKLSYMSSLSSLLYIKPDKQILNDILIFADPEDNLPAIKNEVEKIPQLFKDSKVLYKGEATKKAFYNYWDKYEALHYSGHFRYIEDKPLYSYLECAGNERISLSNIYELESEKLSFLSLGGCSSGLSKIYKGEEIGGMVRGFFYAGVKSILVTLWDVEDRSTSEFLVIYYKELQNNNGNKKTALINTYNYMKEKYEHPFFYAAFILYEGLY